jgi:hypothetical protein
MAGMTGMDAAMQASAPKPAIAADPASSAPSAQASPATQATPAAPRNGNSGAAPTTVQPIQPAGGHQGTQASPAPTQVQRVASGSGTTNGGAPTGSQATKQAPNGKEDDEDWWTE